jgi:integral membrane protein (TIGR01906 family)
MTASVETTHQRPVRALFVALSWLVTLLTPIALVLTAVRLLLTPAFLPFEYNMPGFPQDPYGFTKEDRLHWSRYALDYLLNDAGIEYLGDLRFASGEPVYNPRELQHMLDVKNAIKMTLKVWYWILTALVLLALWAWVSSWVEAYRSGLGRGGWLTAGLLVIIMVFVLLSFNVFFVAFHNVFFQPGTWVFNYSDTLIRLFPERFWQDIFIYVGLLSGLGGISLGYFLRPKRS